MYFFGRFLNTALIARSLRPASSCSVLLAPRVDRTNDLPPQRVKHKLPTCCNTKPVACLSLAQMLKRLGVNEGAVCVLDCGIQKRNFSRNSFSLSFPVASMFQHLKPVGCIRLLTSNFLSVLMWRCPSSLLEDMVKLVKARNLFRSKPRSFQRVNTGTEYNWNETGCIFFGKAQKNPLQTRLWNCATRIWRSKPWRSTIDLRSEHTSRSSSMSFTNSRAPWQRLNRKRHLLWDGNELTYFVKLKNYTRKRDSWGSRSKMYNPHHKN